MTNILFKPVQIANKKGCPVQPVLSNENPKFCFAVDKIDFEDTN